MSKPGDQPMFPGKRMEMKTRPQEPETMFPVEVSYPGMTIRQAFVMAAMQSWIIALSARRNEPGYTDQGVIGEVAHKLAIDTADACLAREAETRNENPELSEASRDDR